MASSPAALRLRVFPEAYSVCRIASASGVDESGRLAFLSRTDEELSLVCESAKAPADALAPAGALARAGGCGLRNCLLTARAAHCILRRKIPK